MEALDPRQAAEELASRLQQSEYEFAKFESHCEGCRRKVQAFQIPDGRIICPNCSPRPVYERWVREWNEYERELKRIEKQAEKERAATAPAQDVTAKETPPPRPSSMPSTEAAPAAHKQRYRQPHPETLLEIYDTSRFYGRLLVALTLGVLSGPLLLLGLWNFSSLHELDEYRGRGFIRGVSETTLVLLGMYLLIGLIALVYLYLLNT